MFCKKCGKKNKDEAKFCQKCGTLLQTKEEKEQKEKSTEIKGKKLEGPVGVGGWLILPLLNFFLIFPYVAITEIIFLTENQDILGIFGTLIVIAETALACFALYTGYLLVKIKDNAVKNTKRVLFAELALTIVSIIWMASLFSSYGVAYEGADTEVYSEYARSIIFAIIWLMYFYSSKRVKNTYKN